MNKHEFIAELSILLKVKPADKASIIEEYESYIAEALASGEREEDIIGSLETPAQIAEHANLELGEDAKERFFDSSSSAHQARKDPSSSAFFDELDAELEKAFQASEKAIKRASETINKSIKGINFGSMLDKVMDGVDKVVDGVMDLDIKGTASAVAMRFDNSKVESYPVGSKQVTIQIEDENSDVLLVEIVQGQSQWMVKYLPTSLKCDINFQQDSLLIRVPQTNIKFAEKKRLRLYIPELLEHITIRSNCPVTLKEVKTNTVLEVTDVVCTIKSVTMDQLTVTVADAPCTIKDATVKELVLTANDAPVSIKDVRSNSMQLHVSDGPVSLSGLQVQSLWLEAGDGPKMLRHSTIKELIVQSTGGPFSLKELHVDVLKGQVEGYSIHMKDCVIKDNQLGELR
jgi:hypothetical protein